MPLPFPTWREADAADSCGPPCPRYRCHCGDGPAHDGPADAVPPEIADEYDAHARAQRRAADTARIAALAAAIHAQHDPTARRNAQRLADRATELTYAAARARRRAAHLDRLAALYPQE